MADRKSFLEGYYGDGLDVQSGYVPEGVRRHPAIPLDRTAPENPIASGLRGAASAIPSVPKRGDFLDYLPSLSEMIKGGLGSVASWASGQPQTQDMLTPMGATAFASAPAGALASNIARRSAEASFLDRMRNRIGEMRDAGAGKQEMISETARMRREEFTKLYQEGRSYDEMRDLLGVERVDGLAKTLPADVARRSRGWDSRMRDGFWERHEPTIRRMHAEGASDPMIAKALYVSPQSIFNRRKEMGLPALQWGGRPALKSDPSASLPGTLVPQPREEGDLAALLAEYYSEP